MLTLFIRP